MAVKRFFETFQPEEYDLFLDVSKASSLTLADDQDAKLAAKPFSGKVAIFGVQKTNDSFWLHAKDLGIVDIKVDGELVDFTVVDDGLEIKSTKTNTKINVEINFSGQITDAMHGIYPAYYKKDGQTEWLIGTQFESHHAREAFPCVDEPEAKAKFKLTLKTAVGQDVVSGMPIESQIEAEEGAFTTKFESSPVMSSYLLAFVVGKLQKKSAQTKSGTLVSAWSTTAQDPELLDFPLDIATRALDFYEDYFGVKFPLAKCDHVALPDFSSGAMENWGLITYRESAMLAGAASALSSKRYVATVITHELAHQWFGNLVTMKWWDDLWLNESFATMIEYLAVDAIEPSWNIWQDFAVNESTLALRRDAIDGVQSVWTPVHHPDEINTIFDGAIVYAKGARLINMLRVYLGETDFRQGLQNYFKKFAYKNTVGADLWQCFREVSGKDVAGFMQNWLIQPGFPVVSAGGDKLDEAEAKLTLSQKQFFVGEGKDKERLWPILLRANNDALPKIFKDKTGDFKVQAQTTPHCEKCANTAFLQLNQGNISHFITNYSDELYEKLLAAVRAGELDTISRLQMLQERSLLARGKQVPSADLIKTLVMYDKESSLAVWDVMGLILADIKVFIEPETSADKQLRQLAGGLAKNQFERLGFEKKEGEHEEDTQLRPAIISYMIYSQDATVMERATAVYHQANNLEEIDANLRSVILQHIVREHETPELIDQFIEEYAKTSDVELKQDLLAALTATKKIQTGEKLLGVMMNPQIVRPQDLLHWYIYMIRNHNLRELAWHWLRNEWQWVKETFAGDKSYDDFPRYSSNILKTEAHLAEYQQFFGPLKTEPGLTRSIEMGEKEIRARVDLIKQEGPSVRAELDKLFD